MSIFAADLLDTIDPIQARGFGRCQDGRRAKWSCQAKEPSVAQPLDIEPIEFTCADTDDHGGILESGGYGRQRMRQ